MEPLLTLKKRGQIIKEKGLVFSFSKKIIYPFRWYVLLQIMISIILAFDTSFRPYLLKLILDCIPNASSNGTFSELVRLVVLYLIIAVLIVFLYRFYDYLILKSVPKMKKQIGALLSEQLMGHAHSFFQNNLSGSLASKINDVVAGIPNILKVSIQDLFFQLVTILVAIITLSFVDIKFSIGLLIWIIIFIGGSLLSTKGAKTLSEEAAELRSHVMGRIIDMVSNIMTVRLFAGRKVERRYLGLTMDKSVVGEQKRDWFFLKIYLFQGGSFAVFQAFCLWWLVVGIHNGTVTVGDFALVLAINISIIDSLWDVARVFTEFTENLGNVSQGLTLIMSPHEIEDKREAKEFIVKRGRIEFENVHFHYKKEEEPLFSNKSVLIEAGSKVGLVGYSGSGKTTFINLILRLFDVNSGRILIDDQDISIITQDSLRKEIAMIPQDPVLFHRSLLENIRYGNLLASDEEVKEAAKKASAHEFISKIGYDALVGERGVKLSGGQRQRITIARAILKNAPILILDEATSQLDSVIEGAIQESLWDVMEGKTSLVIAHRLSTLLKMDRVLVFDRGRIVGDGSHKELLHNCPLYKALWDAQVGGFLPKKKD